MINGDILEYRERISGRKPEKLVVTIASKKEARALQYVRGRPMFHCSSFILFIFSQFKTDKLKQPDGHRHANTYTHYKWIGNSNPTFNLCDQIIL